MAYDPEHSEAPKNTGDGQDVRPGIYPVVVKPNGETVELHTLFAVEQVLVLVEHPIGS